MKEAEIFAALCRRAGVTAEVVGKLILDLGTAKDAQSAIKALERERLEIENECKENLARNQKKIDSWRERCPHPILGAGDPMEWCELCGKTFEEGKQP